MKNKYKVAGVLNILFGVFELLAILLIMSLLLILYFLDGKEGFLILWFIFIIPMLLFAIPSVRHSISFIRTGVQMMSGNTGDAAFKHTLRTNMLMKILFIFACVFTMVTAYVRQGNEVFMQGRFLFFFAIFWLISVILDIMVLRERNEG